MAMCLSMLNWDTPRELEEVLIAVLRLDVYYKLQLEAR